MSKKTKATTTTTKAPAPATTDDLHTCSAEQAASVRASQASTQRETETL